MICKECKEDKEPTEFEKYRLECKKCKGKKSSEWRRNNKERVSIARKKNRLSNLEEHRKKDKEKNKKYSERFKEYRENNPEKVKEAVRKWQKNNKEKIAEWRSKNRDKCLDYTYRWIEKHPEKALVVQRKSAQIQRERFPEKNNARKMVYYAIGIGMMIRPTSCSRCSIECKPDAHHPDYSKPLEVIWLCRECHNKEHGKCRRQNK